MANNKLTELVDNLTAQTIEISTHKPTYETNTESSP